MIITISMERSIRTANKMLRIRLNKPAEVNKFRKHPFKAKLSFFHKNFQLLRSPYPNLPIRFLRLALKFSRIFQSFCSLYSTTQAKFSWHASLLFFFISFLLCGCDKFYHVSLPTPLIISTLFHSSQHKSFWFFARFVFLYSTFSFRFPVPT